MVFTGQRAAFPLAVQTIIDNHWADLLRTRTSLTRGSAFTIKEMIETPASIDVYVDQTDYAHYMASMLLPEITQHFPCRVMHTAVLIHTSDNQMIFAEMGPATAAPGRLQCAGGGISLDDLLPNQMFDVVRNAANELHEEIGLHCDDLTHVSDFKFSYLKTGGPRDFVSAIFVAHTPLTADDVCAHFAAHNTALQQKGETPELARLVCLPIDSRAVDEFLHTATLPLDDYMPDLLRTYAQAFGSCIAV